MTSKFNLSSKAALIGKESNFRKEHVIYFEEDVVKFVKEIKNKIDGLDFFMSGSKIRFDDWLKEELNKLAGERLR